MTGPGGWGVLEEITAAGGARPVVVTDAGYGDNTTFRVELDARGWRYAVAVKGTTSGYAGDAQPVTRTLGGGPGRPPRPACPAPPATLRQLAIASADQVRPVTWRQGTKATNGNPDAAMTSWFVAIRVRPANRDIPRSPDGSLPECWLLAEWPPEADEPTDSCPNCAATPTTCAGSGRRCSPPAPPTGSWPTSPASSTSSPATSTPTKGRSTGCPANSEP